MENPSNPTSNQSNLSQFLPPLTSAPTPTPVRGPYHRRAQSEFQFRLPGDLGFDESLGGFDELGSEDDLFNLDMDIENLGFGSGSDSAGASAPVSDNPFPSENGGGEAGNSRTRHRHSLSVDSSSIEAKKAMARDKLYQLWRVDPKKAKRVVANRESAARSKERKALYVKELKKRVETLQTEATILSAQMSVCQSDTTDLSSENAALKIRLQDMAQKAKILNALNEQLKKNVEMLKFAVGEASSADAYNLGMAQMQYQQQPQQLFFGHHQQQNDAQNLQQMTHQFDLFQPNNNQNMSTSSRPNPPTNHQLMHHATSNFPAQSHSYSEVIHEDPLGRLQGLDISSCSRGSNFGRSDIETESSSTM